MYYRNYTSCPWIFSSSKLVSRPRLGTPLLPRNVLLLNCPYTNTLQVRRNKLKKEVTVTVAVVVVVVVVGWKQVTKIKK